MDHGLHSDLFGSKGLCEGPQAFAGKEGAQLVGGGGGCHLNDNVDPPDKLRTLGELEPGFASLYTKAGYY